MSLASNFTGNVPDYYDKGLGPVLFEVYADDITARAAAVASTNLLELAAGTGIVTRRLRTALAEDINIIATDLNPPMIDYSAKKFKSGENVKFQPVDATDLPFEDASFDTIVCQYGVMFFPDRERSYRETYRVLSDGGTYLFNVWGSLDVNPLIKHANSLLDQFFENDPPQFLNVPFGYDDPDGIKASLEAADFKEIEITRLKKQVKIHDVPLLAKSMVHGNPLAEEIKNLGGNPDDAVKAVQKMIEEHFGSTGIVPLEAMVVSATK